MLFAILEANPLLVASFTSIFSNSVGSYCFVCVFFNFFIVVVFATY